MWRAGQGGLVDPSLTFVGSSEKAAYADNVLSVNSVWPGGSAKDQMFISILAMPGPHAVHSRHLWTECPGSCDWTLPFRE